MAVPVAVDDVASTEAAVRNALRPVDARVIAVELDRTIALFGTPDRWDDITGSYFEALEDLPEDLLLKACRHVRLNCRFFPRPSEFRDPIRDELSVRKVALRKLEMMASRASQEIFHAVARREQDPARRAEIAEQAVATVRASARTVVMSTPSTADDLPQRTYAESLKRAAAGLASFRLAEIGEAEADEMLRRWPEGGAR